MCKVLYMGLSTTTDVLTMPKSCCVVGCCTTLRKNPDLKFYIIPVEPTRRKKWLQAINRVKLIDGKPIRNLLWSPRGAYTYVCSKHFISGQKSNDPNHPDYVPSVFPSSASTMDSHNAAKLQRYNRYAGRSASCRQLFISEDTEVSDNTDDLPSTPGEQTQIEAQDTCTTSSSVSPVNTPPSTPTPDLNMPLEPSEREAFIFETANLRRERDEALAQVEKQKSLLQTSGLSYDSVSGDDAKCLMMTGVKWVVFLHMFNYLSQFLGKSATNRWSLPLQDQMFLTLVKLRHDPTFDFLSCVRCIPKSTVINYFWKWIDLIHTHMLFMVRWPDREGIYQLIPPLFRRQFPRLTSIIDCFEIFIEAPKDLMARAQCYSSYKKHTTVKVFISCNPIGQINFISNVWGGRTSDVEIVRKCGFIDRCYHHPGDQILADRGFLLKDDFATVCQAELCMPAFTKGKKQLTAKEVETSRTISNIRIHIERIIGLLKGRYTILQGTIPVRSIQRLGDEAHSADMSSIDSLVKVCAILINLGESIVHKQ